MSWKVFIKYNHLSLGENCSLRCCHACCCLRTVLFKHFRVERAVDNDFYEFCWRCKESTHRTSDPFPIWGLAGYGNLNIFPALYVVWETTQVLSNSLFFLLGKNSRWIKTIAQREKERPNRWLLGMEKNLNEITKRFAMLSVVWMGGNAKRRKKKKKRIVKCEMQ